MDTHHPAFNQNDIGGQAPRTVLAQRLSRLRRNRQLSIAELGQITQCSPSFLKKMEDGIMIPSRPMLQRLARALGVTSSSLVSEIVQSVGDHSAAARVTDSEQEP